MKALILLLVSNLSYATVFEINPDHSKINFEIDYMTLTKVNGQFKKYNGKFEFNSEKKVLSNLKASIEARSIDTNEQKRDFHLKGHEFLFANSYPNIEFEASNPVNVIEKKKVKMNGELTIRGIKKPVVGELTYKGSMTDPWGKVNQFFEFETHINRKDFGMNWNKELDQGGYLVGDEIKVVINVQAQKEGDKTSFSTHMIPATKGIIEREQLKKGKIKKLSTSTDPKDHK